MPIIQTQLKGKTPVIESLNVTPSTSAQQITAPQGTDGYSPVNVSAVTSSIDANIIAGNIKDGVSILGVTGSYSGIIPTGTKQITANGTHDVSTYEYAEVNVPSTAPNHYVKYQDSSLATKDGYLMNFSGFTDVGTYAFYYLYANNTYVYGNVDMSNFTKFSNEYSCSNMFLKCTWILSVDLSNLEGIYGRYACQSMFNGCTRLASANLSSLYNVALSGCSGMFQGCSGLTSVDLSSLQYVANQNGCSSMFYNCTGLTSINSNILKAGNSSCNQMFRGCTGLTSANLAIVDASVQSSFSSMFQGCSSLATVDISHLAKLGTSSNLSSMFSSCTSLTSLSFNNLAYTATNCNSSFQNMLSGVTGCTVHFPAEWETDMANWSNITNGMGGTNTKVLFDLPNVRTLDLSHITTINCSHIFSGLGGNGYFPYITKVDLSNLRIIESGAQNSISNAFYNCTSLTSIDLSSLETIAGMTGCNQMFQGCTGLTSVDLSSLQTVSGSYGCHSMFQGCTGLTSADLSSLQTVTGSQGCSYMFSGCTNLTTVDLSSLETVTYAEANCCYYMFENCTSLTTLSFPALKTIDPGCFNYALDGTSGVTVHFPSNLESLDLGRLIGGTNTTVLYDLPSTAD